MLTVKIQCNTCHQMASLASKLYKIQFRPGLRPDPADAFPEPLVGWGGGNLLQFLKISGYATEGQGPVLYLYL